MKKERWTLLEVLRWTTGRFEERGIPTPRLDAELLIAAALGLSRVQLYVQFERPLEPDELATIRDHVRRRQAGESVAYIVGRKEFYGLDFQVDARVLVPRPDTETLIDEVLERLRAGWQTATTEVPARDLESHLHEPGNLEEGGSAQPTEPTLPTAAVRATRTGSERRVRYPGGKKIADVGTGSGAIAVTLAKQLPGDTSIFAVDAAAPALEVARANAARHGAVVTFLEGDLGAPLSAHAPFDVIAANLPYVPTAEIDALAPEVRGEPRGALDGGGDGLELVARLIRQAPALLARGGVLALEIGAGQAEQTAALCRDAGLIDTRVRCDLGGIERVVSAVKS